MERESFVFYRSFYEAIENLPDELQLEAHKSILKYALDGIEPQGNNIVKAIFMLIKPQIDANNKRFIDGQKGGRPPKKTTGYENNNHSVTTKEPNVNVNVNVNDNVNDNENVNNSSSSSSSSSVVEDEFSNYIPHERVLITEQQKAQIDCLTQSSELTTQLIEALNDEIGIGKYPKFSAENPDAHFILLKKFYNFRKKNNTGKTIPFKSKTDKKMDAIKEAFKNAKN